MTSITQDDAQAVWEYERFEIILREVRGEWTKVRSINQELKNSHDRLERLEKEGLSILERMQQRDSCAPRVKQMAREAVIAGWTDLDNSNMRNDPTFKQLVPETSFLFRASAYIEGIQESSLNNHLQIDPTSSPANSTPFPSLTSRSGEASGSSQPSPQSGESMRQRALSVVTVLGRRIHRLISSPTASSPTPSEAAQEREDLDRSRQVQGHVWLTQRYQGGRMATQPGPLLDKYTVSWPTSDEPIEFVPLLETALGLHFPGCPFQTCREIVHSGDQRRGHFRSLSSNCDAYQAGILVERKITEFIRLLPQGGGHLLSVYDQWNGVWHQSQVCHRDRELVGHGMKFVKRCLKSIIQENGVVDPKNNVSPLPPAPVPPAPVNRTIHHEHRRVSRI